MKTLARRVYRTGVQTVEREGDRWFVTLKNRTNDTRIEVPEATGRRYLAAIMSDQRSVTW